MNFDQLTAKFELMDSFSERRELAVEAVAKLDQSGLAQVARLLGHNVESVRLGAIEILRLAQFRPALKFLAAVTVQRDGDERTFAARAVVELTDPEQDKDRALATSLVSSWRRAGDEYLALHADTLAGKFGLPAAERGPSGFRTTALTSSQKKASPDRPETQPAGTGDKAGEVPIYGITAQDAEVRARAIARTVELLPDAETPLCEAALSSKHSGARLDLVDALRGLGGLRMSNVLEPIVRRGDGDLAALFLRGFRSVMGELSPERLSYARALLEQTRGRFADHQLARAAMDDCLVAARPSDELESLCQSADRIAPEAAYQLAGRLVDLDEEARLSHFNLVFPALQRAPRRALLFAALFEWAWSRLRPGRRDEVRVMLAVAASKPFPGGLSAPAVATIGRLYALAQRSGGRMPGHVLTALDAHHDADTALAAIAIYEAVSTEESARRIAEYLGDSMDAVRDAARDALAGIEAPVNVKLLDRSAVIEPNYQTPFGDPLIARKGSLTTELGVVYLLDENGEPVLADSTPFAGCACCERPRVLRRVSQHTGTDLPACPGTGRAHLVAARKGVLADEHPLGRCRECESVAPLERHGDGVWCSGCNRRFVLRNGVIMRPDR